MTATEDQVRSTFLAALEREPTQWPAFLDEACGGDAELRARVEQLLRSHEAMGSIHVGLAAAGTAAHAATTDIPLRESPGTVIGPYRLLEQIGEGGMGVVFLAEQSHPVRRQVALKVIKAGMDTRQVVARFQSERQALAVMDHPNIAKVFDAGATDSGRPYFVMELVKGVPITRYCDEHRLTPRERLELFVQVCQAIQHAHTKGIIHRDLKPSNVMVALYDGKPVPKVIDFGVAKATDGRLSEVTVFTGFGAVVGTPEYMSPEQAELNQLDIDTRSDVYSLGVILYELLTGSTPLQRKQLNAAALLEVLRVVREQDPPRPSTRLSTTDELASIAASRGLEPRKLGMVVRGELDWIVMKALEKDRDRRYATANGFATDIQRYLADEPVQACPPSATYRFRKFARRHRATVLTAATILFVLVAGIAGTTFGLIKAEQRRAEADQSRAGEAAQRQIADAQKKRAEQAEADTLADYRASTDDAIRQLIGSKPTLGPKERAYLEKTLKRWQAFAARQGDDLRSHVIRAEGHQSVAYIWGMLGQREKARAEYETAIDLLTEVVASPDGARYQASLANAHYNMGVHLAELGQRDAARAEYETALALYKKLADASPAEPRYQRSLASSHHALGNLLKDLSQFDAARREYGTARDLRQKLADAFPTVPQYQDDLADSHSILGLFLTLREQYESARAEYEAARNLYKKLSAAAPDEIEYQEGLGATHNNLGLLLNRLEQYANARTEYESARDIFKKLADAFPALPQYQIKLAGIHGNLAPLLVSLGQRDAAAAEHELAINLHKKLAAAFPAEPENQVALGGGYCNYGSFFDHTARPAESLPWFDLAIRTLTPVYEQDRRAATAREFLRNSYLGRARAYARLNDHAAAAKDWEKIVEFDPSNPKVHTEHGRALIAQKMFDKAVASFHKAIELDPKYPDGYHFLGDALCEQKKLDEAVAAYRKAAELAPKQSLPLVGLARALNTQGKLDEAIASYRTAVEFDPNNAGIHHELGVAHYRAGQWRDAIAALKKSNALYKGEMAGNAFVLAMAHWRVGEKDESRRCFDLAVARMEKYSPQDDQLKRFRAEAMEVTGAGERAD